VVFSMVDFEYIHMSEKLIRDHGNWHIVLSNVPREEAEGVRDEADVAAACRYDTFNYRLDKPIYLDGRPLCVIGTEEVFFTEIMVDMLPEGHFPQNASEVLLNRNAKSILGCEIGDPVTLQTPAGTYSFTISGFSSDTSDSLAAGAVIAIMDYTAFEPIASANGQQREMQYYIQFEKSLSIKNTIARLKAEHGWTEDNVGENAAVLGIMGMSTNNYIVGLYGVAAILMLIVILAGVMMISGSMSTGVAQRTQYFGMLRCIGAGKRQVRHLVRREAFSWLRIGIPAGVAAAMLAAWGVCAVLAYGIGGEWAGMPVGRVSPVGIAAGVIVGYITVLFAAAAPARRAARVSPITAVSGSSEGDFRGVAWNLGAVSVPVSLGVHHMVSKKKNLILMTGSFALSIILFLAFSVIITWVGNALISTKPYSPDISVYYPDYREGLSRELADQMRNADGVKHVYGRMHILTDVENSDKASQIDLISYDDLQFDWAKKDLLRGDLNAVRNTCDAVLVVFGKDYTPELGDTMEVNGVMLRVAALLSDSPFSAGEIPTVICSEATFAAVAGESDYAVIELQLDKNGGDETVAAVRALLSDGVTLSDRRAGKTETNSTYLAFTVLVYGFLALVALIAVFNILNSISMSVTARRRQYGMMRAIGLDRQQLKKMIAAEALGFGVSGCLAGCAIGLPLQAWLFRFAITDYWGVAWQLPVTQLVIIVAVILVASMAAVRAPLRQLGSTSITRSISEP